MEITKFFLFGHWNYSNSIKIDDENDNMHFDNNQKCVYSSDLKRIKNKASNIWHFCSSNI